MTQNPTIQGHESFRAWIDSNLNADVTPLTRILCLLDLCAGVSPEDGEFIEGVLVRVLEKDTDPIVRHEAAFTLYKLSTMHHISGMQALESLCNSARSDISTVARHEAAESLGFFHDPRSLTTLQGLLNDPNPDVVATARISLERLSKG